MYSRNERVTCFLSLNNAWCKKEGNKGLIIRGNGIVPIFSTRTTYYITYRNGEDRTIHFPYY